MSKFSGKTVKDMKEAYPSVYSKSQKDDVLTEEKIYNMLAEELKLLAMEWCEEYIEKGMSDDDILLDEDLMKKGQAVWNVVRPIVKQLTGLGAQPTTRTGRVVRAVQQATVPATVVANPGGSRDIAVGAVTGAFKGAFEGGTQAAGKKEQQQTKQSSSDGLVLPSGWEIGPDGKPRRKSQS